MDVKANLETLQKMKDEAGRKRRTLDKLQAEIDVLTQQLRDRFGFENTKDAAKAITSMEEELEKSSSALTEKINKLKSDYRWESA